MNLREQIYGNQDAEEAVEEESTDVDDTAKVGRHRFKKRSLILKAVITALTGAFAITSMVACGIVSSEASADTSDKTDEINKLKQEAATWEDKEKTLPNATSAQRRVDAAAESAKSLAAYQTTYLAETGKLSYDGVPTVKSEGLDERYSDAERKTMAQQNRKDRIDQANRSIKGLVETVEMTDRSVPYIPWKDLVTVLPKGKDVDLSGYEWKAITSPVFNADGGVNVFFILVNKKEPEKRLARATGEYDPKLRVIKSIVITEVQDEVKQS